MDMRFQLLQVCFFVSGFAALLYETAWTREFAFVFGTSELAVIAVLAAYMAGLALGAALAGRWAHRIRRPVFAYGLIELGIGLGALMVPFAIRGLMSVYVNWLGGLDAPPESVGLATALFHLAGAFLVLVPCTALMGATLPLLARHAVQNNEQVGPRIGYLYSVNTAGAICGAVTAAFFLLPEFGLRQTIYFGALANGLVFGAAALLSRYAPAAEGIPPRRSTGFSPILFLIAISGMVSFAYEVLWVRLLGFVLGGSTAAFATMLASFLIGISLGSAVASRFARDSARAGLGFATAQLMTALMAWVTFSLADSVPSLASYFNASSSNLLPGAAVAILVLLPVTTCIGASFPFAVRLMAQDVDDAASASARVYAWNTLGSIVGSAATGFWLLPAAGFEGTLLVGATLNLTLAIVAAVLFTSGSPMRVIAGLALAVGCILMVGKPGPPLKLLNMSILNSGNSHGQMDFLGVGRSATVTLNRLAYAHQISTNGLPESMVQSSANPPDLYHAGRWLGLLPLLARPDTENILIIGLGGGRTLGAVPPPIQAIDLIELEPEVVTANRYVVGLYDLPDPLDDPRLTLRIGDARGALMLTGTNYDAIISQPSHPWTSGASHLYTKEFFSLVKDRLTPEGVFVQWMGLTFVDGPLLRGLVGTLSEVFEHVTVLLPGGAAVLFIASNEEIDFVKTAEQAIASAPASFETIGVHTLADVVAAICIEKEASREYASGYPIITDDHNHLAWASGRTSNKRKSLEAGQALKLHDGLLNLASEVDPGLLVRRLRARRSTERARLIVSQLPAASRRVAQGWLMIANGRPLRAREAFRKALELDPESQSAKYGFTLASPEGADVSDWPRPEAAVIEGELLSRAGEWLQLQALDARLSEVAAGSTLYPEAARLRASWRLASRAPVRGWEAVELIDVLIARDQNPWDLLLRAEGAGLSGRSDYAWASLSRLSSSMKRASNRKHLAKKALQLASKLPPGVSSGAIVRRLKAQALEKSATRKPQPPTP